MNTENTLALLRQKGVIEAKGAAVCAGEAQKVTRIPRDRKLAVGWVGTCKPISIELLKAATATAIPLWLDLRDPLKQSSGWHVGSP